MRPFFSFIRVVALIIKDGSILLEPPWEAERGERQELWNAPGGALEPGETIGEAVKREVFEETGLEVETLGIAYVAETVLTPEEAVAKNEPIMSVEICCYARLLTEDAVPTTEHPYEKPAEWVPIERVAQLPTLPFNLRGWAAFVSRKGMTHIAPLTSGAYSEDLEVLSKPFIHTSLEQPGESLEG